MPEFPIEEPRYVGGGLKENGKEGGGVVPGEADAAFDRGWVKWSGCGKRGREMARLPGRRRRRP